MIVTLILLALKSLLVAAATLGLLRLTRARSAAQRSTIAHLGLFALVALPLGSLALPSLALPVPAVVADFAAVGPIAAPVVSLAPSTATAPIDTDTFVKSAAKPAATSTLIATVAGAARYAFLLPTFVLLMLTLVALLRLVGLRARADVLVDPDWLSALARAQRRMGFKNGTALLWSDELGSPVSWGLMRPVILLNNAAVAAPEQAEAIIAHELAHVVHFDWAKLILARVATATFWFNPLAWVLAYSSRNRSASCRIPYGTGAKAKRVEVRFPDAMANPYLAYAALFMAGLDGIQNKLHPGDAMDKNLYDLPPAELAEVPTVCGSLREALDSLEADMDFLLKGDVFSKDQIEAYIEIKRADVARFEMTPSPVEFDMYYSA
jgi:beta-lactamase regulating signal transducer with metallopeptidase domain